MCSGVQPGSTTELEKMCETGFPLPSEGRGTEGEG